VFLHFVMKFHPACANLPVLFSMTL
jgi:hypothetical protein